MLDADGNNVPLHLLHCLRVRWKFFNGERDINVAETSLVKKKENKKITHMDFLLYLSMTVSTSMYSFYLYTYKMKTIIFRC